MTVPDVASAVGVTEATVRVWLRSGELAGVRYHSPVGWRVARADLLAFLERRADPLSADDYLTARRQMRRPGRLPGPRGQPYRPPG